MRKSGGYKLNVRLRKIMLREGRSGEEMKLGIVKVYPRMKKEREERDGVYFKSTQ